MPVNKIEKSKIAIFSFSNFLLWNSQKRKPTTNWTKRIAANECLCKKFRAWHCNSVVHHQNRRVKTMKRDDWWIRNEVTNRQTPHSQTAIRLIVNQIKLYFKKRRKLDQRTPAFDGGLSNWTLIGVFVCLVFHFWLRNFFLKRTRNKRIESKNCVKESTWRMCIVNWFECLVTHLCLRRDRKTEANWNVGIICPEMNEAIPPSSPSPNDIHHEYRATNQSQSVNLSEIIVNIYHRAVGHSTETLEHIVYFFGLYAIVCVVVYVLIVQKWLTQWYRHATNVRLPNTRRALICIAHPDDESMFFGPTILSLTKRTDCQVYLLCLSNGLVLQPYLICLHWLPSMVLSLTNIVFFLLILQAITVNWAIYDSMSYGMHAKFSIFRMKISHLWMQHCYQTIQRWNGNRKLLQNKF